MIIEKITHGYVVQSYDTEAKIWLHQEFVAGDFCRYQDSNGTRLESDAMGKPKPSLRFNMVQPK